MFVLIKKVSHVRVGSRVGDRKDARRGRGTHGPAVIPVDSGGRSPKLEFHDQSKSSVDGERRGGAGGGKKKKALARISPDGLGGQRVTPDQAPRPHGRIGPAGELHTWPWARQHHFLDVPTQRAAPGTQSRPGNE